MKLLLLLSLLAVTTFAQAKSCSTYEALVFGGVVQTIKEGDKCYIEIDVDQISEHALCPLARVDIELSRIEDVDCSYNLGDEVKAVIIQSDKAYLSIDK
jgi:hypothetical protein